MSSQPTSGRAGAWTGFDQPRTIETWVGFGTPIGVDVGRRHLLTLAPASAGPDVADGLAIAKDQFRERYRELERRHQGQHDRVNPRMVEQLERVLDEAVQEALAYVQRYATPVLVLEDLTYPGNHTLRDCLESATEVDAWLYPRLQELLGRRARESGIPVTWADPKHTTKECHICREFASFDGDTITCATDDCPVEKICRDRSAAVSIAKRIQTNPKKNGRAHRARY